MNIIQLFFECLESLAANKLRSALTVLGIVIGVAAVIAMLAIGRGAQQSINDQINSLGTNLIYINPGAENVRNPRPLTTGDAAALADPAQAPSIAEVSPLIQGRMQVSQRGESINTTVYAITDNYMAMRSLSLAEGQGVDAGHVRSRAAVAVLGSQTATSLFGRTSGLLGASIRIQNQSFRVIGVLESSGGGGFGSQDDLVLVPISTAQSRLLRRSARDQLDSILVQTKNSEVADQAMTEINTVLTARHRTPRSQPDFSTLNQEDILETAASITGVLSIFLGGIGGISLLVGGIGIMNIMLVTVSERTREIGLRKALGAHKRDILIQFLAESALLSLLGGIIGIILAWLLAMLVAQVAASNDVDFTPQIEWSAVLLATVFSAGVGLFFGFYPAQRAASLQPVEALRYE